MVTPNLQPRVAFGRAVREIRHERGFTQEALGRQAGIHWTYIGGVERGERNPSWDNVVRIAAALEVSVAELSARAEQLMQRSD